jgi:hypothetical protein
VQADIIAYLTSRHFGLRASGEIYGYAFATYVLAGALGPWLMGGFDRSPVLIAFLAATRAKPFVGCHSVRRP